MAVAQSPGDGYAGGTRIQGQEGGQYLVRVPRSSSGLGDTAAQGPPSEENGCKVSRTSDLGRPQYTLSGRGHNFAGSPKPC
jgi:hypothetical protein